MKITVDVQPLLHEKTGIGQYTYHFLQALQDIDTENEYRLTFFSVRKKHVFFPIRNARFEINRKGLLPGRVLEKLWKICNAPKYDYLSGKSDIFHFPNFIIHPVSQGKTIATIHDLSFRRYPQYTEPGNLVYLNQCIDRTLLRAHHILADSLSTKQQIIEDFGYPDEKISVIHLGVADHFQKITDQAILDRLREKYSLPGKYVFCLGTIEPRKNLKTLFEAFNLLKKENASSDCKLVLTGMKGWLLDEVYAPLREHNLENDVVFTGYVPDKDLAGLYSLAEIFVFPSFYEGFGLPPLEAMACGIPVLSSHASSLPEVLRSAAFYFNPESAEELATALANMLSNVALRQDLIEKGSLHVQKFTWKKTAENILKVYEKVYNDG